MSLSSGNIAGALLRRAGPLLQEECQKLAPIEDGDVVVTDGYELPCKQVLHSCPPHWEKGITEKVKDFSRFTTHLIKKVF